jgi:hypothetical protein
MIIEKVVAKSVLVHNNLCFARGLQEIYMDFALCSVRYKCTVRYPCVDYWNINIMKAAEACLTSSMLTVLSR